MKHHGGGIVALLWAALLPTAVVTAAVHPFIITAGPVQPSALPAGANFGSSAAISDSGKRLVVGANGYGDNTGAWYAYAVGKSAKKTHVSWTAIQGPITGSTNQSLGLSIALSGNGKVVVVGAPGLGNTVASTAYVYTWSQASKHFSTVPQDLATLVTPAPPNYSQFGNVVAISANGNVIAVSQTVPHAVHIFTSSANGYVLAQTISGGDQLLGYSLALSKTGDILVAGAPSAESGQGRVYTFQRSKSVGGGGTWTQLGTFITRPGTPANDGFGLSIGLSRSGKVLAVGSPYLGTDDQGAVSVWAFSKTAGWTIVEPALLPASPLLPNSLYGYRLAVSASGSRILVSSDGFSSGPGRVWAFTKTAGGAYTQTGGPLVGAPCPSTPISDAFGYSLALAAAAKPLVVSAPNWREAGPTTYGTFYSFAARA